MCVFIISEYILYLALFWYIVHVCFLQVGTLSGRTWQVLEARDQRGSKGYIEKNVTYETKYWKLTLHQSNELKSIDLIHFQVIILYKLYCNGKGSLLWSITNAIYIITRDYDIFLVGHIVILADLLTMIGDILPIAPAFMLIFIKTCSPSVAANISITLGSLKRFINLSQISIRKPLPMTNLMLCFPSFGCCRYKWMFYLNWYRRLAHNNSIPQHSCQLNKKTPRHTG